jgi:hypothetical protein
MMPFAASSSEKQYTTIYQAHFLTQISIAPFLKSNILKAAIAI